MHCIGIKGAIQFQQQSCPQLYKCTQLEVMPNFYTIHSPMHCVWHKRCAIQFHQQNCAQLYKCTQLEVLPNFYYTSYTEKATKIYWYILWYSISISPTWHCTYYYAFFHVVHHELCTKNTNELKICVFRVLVKLSPWFIRQEKNCRSRKLDDISLALKKLVHSLIRIECLRTDYHINWKW